MATTTTKPAQRQQTAQPAQSQGQVAVIPAPRLAPPPQQTLAEYKVNDAGWRTLVETIFPGATSVASIMMALEYCKHRNLDVFKKPVHVVPIWNSQAISSDGKKGAMVETIWPGINELRTTATRTGQFAGMDVTAFGPMIEKTFKGKIKKWQNGQSFFEDVQATVTFPEWCQITVYRVLGGNRVPFPGPRVYWLETYASLRNDVEVPNSMWEKRPSGQLEKCAEAAALRRAFPEEIGSDYSIDEIGAFTTHAPADVTADGSATTSTSAAEPTRNDPKYQAAPGATPHSEPATGGQAESPPPAGGAKAGPSGQPRPRKVTDVVDETEQKPPIKPLTFQDYKRIGDFFIFADAWIVEPQRTEAELIAFSTFYQEYMLERLDPAYKAPPVRNAMLDTKRLLDEAITRAQKKPAAPQDREPGQEG